MVGTSMLRAGVVPVYHLLVHVLEGPSVQSGFLPEEAQRE